MSFSILPIEIKSQILSCVPGTSLDSCSLVCQEWNNLIQDRYRVIWDKVKNYFTAFPRLPPFDEQPSVLCHRQVQRLERVLRKIDNPVLQEKIKNLSPGDRLIWFFNLKADQFLEVINLQALNESQVGELIRYLGSIIQHPHIDIISFIRKIEIDYQILSEKSLDPDNSGYMNPVRYQGLNMLSTQAQQLQDMLNLIQDQAQVATRLFLNKF